MFYKNERSFLILGHPQFLEQKNAGCYLPGVFYAKEFFYQNKLDFFIEKKCIFTQNQYQ